MARFRRIPKKNRNKLKFVDPFNKKGRVGQESREKKLNRPPTVDEIDQQTVPKSTLEIACLQKEVSDTSAERKPRRKKRNIFTEATKNAGFKKKQFESDSHFMRRFHRETHSRVQEELLKVRFGIVGRNQNEVYKEIKNAKYSKNQKEDKSNRIKEKVGCSGIDNEKSTKMNRKILLKMKKRRAKSDEFDKLLNAHEMIPFGERVDAPPELNMFRSNPIKAESRQLLLNSLIRDKEAKKSRENPHLISERQRVISAYRSLKGNG